MSRRTDRAASAKPSMLEFCRVVMEEDESQIAEITEILVSQRYSYLSPTETTKITVFSDCNHVVVDYILGKNICREVV